MINYLRHKRDGFTVVELLVAVGLFTTIVSVAMGSYIRILQGQRLMTELMAANDNVSLVMEQMAREIRTGKDFNVVGIDRTAINFKNDVGQCVQYAWDSKQGAITRAVVDALNCQTAIYSGEEVLTADTVKVNSLIFDKMSQRGKLGIDFDRITIRIKLQNVDESFSKENILQTTISARRYFQ